MTYTFLCLNFCLKSPVGIVGHLSTCCWKTGTMCCTAALTININEMNVKCIIAIPAALL